MTKTFNFDFRAYLEAFRKGMGIILSPPWLKLLMVFFVLYAPFLLQYGWQYRDIPNFDLPSFYTASVGVFRHGESPYDLERMRLLVPPGVDVFPYLYPPPSLFLFFPLSVLTYENARHDVLIINHLLFLVLIWTIPLYLLRARPRYDLGVFALCIVYSLTFNPVVANLQNGQVNILLLAFLMLFWLFARNRNSVLAAFFLALAIVLKTYPLIIIPMLLLIGRWREGLYASAWIGLATLVSLILFPNTIWHDWLTNVLPKGGYINSPHGVPVAAIWNQSLNGFFARAFTESEWSNPLSVNPGLARLLTYVTAGLMATASCIVVWRSRVHIDSLDRMILVALPLTYLVAPLSWESHLLYLLPVILLLLNSRVSFSLVPRTIFYALCIVSAITISIPHLIQFKFYGVVILWVLCVFTAVKKDVELPNAQAEFNHG
jgi:Glycosyltransferase family 87